MPNKKYVQGANFERQVKNVLEAMGYYAIRSAGSHGVADVVALSPDDEVRPLMVQCKLRGAFPADEREELMRTADEFRADAALAVKTRKSLDYPDGIIWEYL